MNLQDFLNVLRLRWVTIAVTTTIATTAAVIITLLTTPFYEASTRLFVSTESGSSLSDAYQGGRYSQDRVLSYSQLLGGQTLAQRTIDKLDLDMKAEDLAARVKATAKADTVLIDVNVVDESPVRARDIANTLSDEFVIMVRELETPDDRSRPNARVIVEQRASIPDYPVKPKKKRNIALGLAGGLLLGFGLALIKDRLDNTVKNREVLQEITHVGLVGNIPLDKDRKKEAAILFENSNSTIAEAFRKLRTNLQFLAVDNPPNVIVVASALPAEGKTTTAINLGLVLAEAGHNVVIVDGDLRKPKVDQYLGLVGSVGLSTVLSGAANLDDALQVSRFPRLTVLASGVVPPNPSELLGSMAARKVLSDLKQRFDYVIVDSSPLLAVTDTAVLSTNVDGTLVITRFGKTKREQLSHAIKNLEDVGATILGSVFTMAPTGRAASYSYSYGYYGTEDQDGRSSPASSVVDAFRNE